MIKQQKIIAAFMLIGCTGAYSAPFNSFDPRSMAMGGTGVAVANPTTAPFFNPALLSSARDDDDFSVGFPIVGARAYDPDDFADSVDDFQNNSAILDANDDFVIDAHITNLEGYLATANQAAAVTELTAINGDILALSSGLETLNDKPVGVEVGVGLVVGIPSKSLGAALSISGWGAGGGVAHYRDAATLEALATDLTNYATCVANYPATPCVGTFTYVDIGVAADMTDDTITFDSNADVKSTVDLRAISVVEVAVSFAREFTLMGGEVSFGITPKYRKIRIFDYTAYVNTAENDDFDAEDYTEEYTDFNVDLGLAKELGAGLRAGFVVKNIIPVSYESKLGNDIELLPQARAGISYQNSWMTAAADLDVTKNDPVSFERETQFASVGIELNAFDWAQVRAGYRTNLAESGGNVASVGLGLSPFGVHFDVALAASEDEVGASAQFGFRF
ncbi:MAG: conjugal transfer protein TraF [Candidatus Polarisedimenticolaceae bacterium]|nr:conjugal transfer protein TraF [Candidatus Polarisedimenticolaceae bacterium]